MRACSCDPSGGGPAASATGSNATDSIGGGVALTSDKGEEKLRTGGEGGVRGASAHAREAGAGGAGGAGGGGSAHSRAAGSM